MNRMGIETNFEPTFTTKLAMREKQIQQNYRPIIGVHKWFARRPGSIFRSLLLAEFGPAGHGQDTYFEPHRFVGVIADPFMGGGTPVYEANRLGFHVIGTDINPMAFWIVRQALVELDVDEFRKGAVSVIENIEGRISRFYITKCINCGSEAQVKYFLWVKVAQCPKCGTDNKLFPGHLVAQNVRHSRNVVVCGTCGALNEYDVLPSRERTEKCIDCDSRVTVEGNTKGNRAKCIQCGNEFPFLEENMEKPLPHELYAIEYHCAKCKPTWYGRFFKVPDKTDHELLNLSKTELLQSNLEIPTESIPEGDETARLHRWGYRFYNQMFNDRQLLGLGLLLRTIRSVKAGEVRNALLTVFSDFLRYQNMICRYDTMALKCQDIFSIHGFPVGLVQCENNIVGIPKVGTGGFRHFVEKYVRAKNYCEHPFETYSIGRRKKVVEVVGESISADLVDGFPTGPRKQAWLCKTSADQVQLPPDSLDGVFTDPPYYDNVQYAELMDFCYVWLRRGLEGEFREFTQSSTRSAGELTGNVTMGRGIEHFTNGLSSIFKHYSGALKPQAPFVFTYHHNNPTAYFPLIVSLLDSRLKCEATLPAVAEMSASLHISGTSSSLLDSIFVCRKVESTSNQEAPVLANAFQWLDKSLSADINSMQESGYEVTLGDIRCLSLGHLTRLSISSLESSWDPGTSLQARLGRAKETLTELLEHPEITRLMTQGLESFGKSKSRARGLATSLRANS